MHWYFPSSLYVCLLFTYLTFQNRATSHVRNAIVLLPYLNYWPLVSLTTILFALLIYPGIHFGYYANYLHHKLIFHFNVLYAGICFSLHLDLFCLMQKLLDTLHQAWPSMSLIASDFSYLPDVSIPGDRAPLVSSKVACADWFITL